MRRILILLMTAGLVVGVAACGDDDNDEGVPSQPDTGELSRSEYSEQAGEKCEDAGKQIADLATSGDPLADQYDQTQVIAGNLVADVDLLVPPMSEQDTVDKMLDGFRKYGDAAGRAADAIAGGADESTEQATFEQEAETALQEASDAATELDIPKCAELVPSSS